MTYKRSRVTAAVCHKEDVVLRASVLLSRRHMFLRIWQLYLTEIMNRSCLLVPIRRRVTSCTAHTVLYRVIHK